MRVQAGFVLQMPCIFYIYCSVFKRVIVWLIVCAG